MLKYLLKGKTFTGWWTGFFWEKVKVSRDSKVMVAWKVSAEVLKGSQFCHFYAKQSKTSSPSCCKLQWKLKSQGTRKHFSWISKLRFSCSIIQTKRQFKVCRLKISLVFLRNHLKVPSMGRPIVYLTDVEKYIFLNKLLSCCYFQWSSSIFQEFCESVHF